VDPSVIQALTSYIPQVVPEAILIVAACVLFLGATWVASRALWGWVALLALALAGAGLWYTATEVPTREAIQERINTLQGNIGAPKHDTSDDPEVIRAEIYQLQTQLDANLYAAPLQHTYLTLLIRVMALVGTVILVLFGWEEVPEKYAAEHHACLLLIAAGLGLTAAANELVTLFLALELISIPTYVLLYLPRADAPAQEAAMKYFLLSIFSSALLLFGFSYLYGLAGTTNLPAIIDVLANARGSAAQRGLPLIAILMVTAGLGRWITAVPFHFYAPDVYQGTAPSGAALLAFVPKVAGFVVLARLLGLVPPAEGSILGDQLPVLLWIMAAVTMTLGNVLALLQSNVKRMLAYSSVAHAGYMLIGLAVAPKLKGAVAVGGVESVLVYLVAYGAMTIGAFAVLSWLSTPERRIETEEDLSGLARSHPGTALVMVLFLFSLIGIPATAGFVGKLLVFFTALEVKAQPDSPADVEQARLFLTLAIIAALNAAIGGWYYLRVAAVMYLRDPVRPIAQRRPAPVRGAIALCAAVTLIVGLYPGPLVKVARSAIRGPESLAGTTAAPAPPVQVRAEGGAP
jgi:NADH-quinone oxidoreductase subunit N